MTRKTGSSQSSYFPGVESSPYDQYLIRPDSNRYGVRGAVPRYGGGIEYGPPSVEHRSSSARSTTRYGRSYKTRDYQHYPSGAGDEDVMITRSGHQGYRGGVDPFEHAPESAPEEFPYPEYSEVYGVEDTAPCNRGWLRENAGWVAFGGALGFLFWITR